MNHASSSLGPMRWVLLLASVLLGLVVVAELWLGNDPQAGASTPVATAPAPTPPPRAAPVPEPEWDEPTSSVRSARTLKGVVRDAVTGAGVPEARIRVGGAEGHSDGNGRFVVEGVAERGRVHASADGYLATEMDLPAGEEITLRLEPTTLLRLVVVRPNGTRVPGARVELSPPNPPRSGTTDARGELRLTGIERGAYQVNARSPDGREAASAEVALPEKGHQTVTLTLGPASSVAGSVTEADGAAAPGASVWVESDDGVRLGNATTGSDGTFEVGGLATDGNVVIHAVRGGRHGKSGTVRLRRGAHETGVRITLEKGGAAIGGLVMDDDGMMVAGARVELAPEWQGGEAVWASVTTGDDGRFLFEDVPNEHHYDVTARLGDLEAVMDDVRPGNTALILQLSASAMIEGRVVDEAGAPVTAFHVRAEFARDVGPKNPQGGMVRRGMDKARDVVDADGRFSLGPFRRGRYEVEVTTVDGRMGRGQGDVLGKASVDVGEIKLRSSGVVTGRVVSRADQNPVLGAVISRFARGAESAVTGVDGRFTIRVPSGGNWLNVSHPGFFEKRINAGNIDPHGAPVDVGDVVLIPGSRREIEGRQGFGGVGARLKGDHGKVVVESLMDEGAGARAGLKAGDVVLSADGEDLSGKSVQEAVSNIRGESGSTVWLKVRRGNEVVEIPVRREPVNMGGP
ncbi:MAG: carboxypeptidase regulatory-like domain-containing protein [Myxococcota bacterium]